jgi:RNA polymerase sigma factor (sigma-70 family)
VSRPEDIEGLLRRLAPQVLAALLRRHRQLDLCEDAVQEALLAAATSWAASGLPANPRGWLLTVATRRLVDDVRSERSRRAREDRIAVGAAPSELLTLGPESEPNVDRDRDDTLALLIMCCHPSLSTPSQIALTLRAVGGLSTAEIAACFFVAEATMAQRISRAKQTIRDAGARFEIPAEPELTARLAAVMHVLYLIFNEGYTTSSGTRADRVELSSEAIRLTRELHRLRPDNDDGDVAALLALMLLTDARRAARTTGTGELIDLADQDRGLWNHAQIHEGVALITAALAHGRLGAYQLQAAVAAVHDEAPSAEATDWPQILALYELLDQIAPNPMATLGRAVAAAMATGPPAGLEILDGLAKDRRIVGHHRFHAVRGQLLEMAGEHEAARDAFHHAARLTNSLPEKRYLTARAAGRR